MRLESKVKVSRLAKYAILVYIMVSLFYTTNHYFASHHVVSSHNRKEEFNQRINSLPKQEPSSPIIVDNKINQNNNVMLQSNQVAWPGSKGKDPQRK